MRKIYFILFCLIIFGCKKNNSFVIKDFNPYYNYTAKNDTLYLDMDLSDAITKGITIPSDKEIENLKYFRFSFSIRNNSNSPKIYYYKIYYQNETYKIQEYTKIGDTLNYNILSANNFYGSWENSAEEFHKTVMIPNDEKFYKITDSFRIVGNPREEEKYFGPEPINVKPNTSDIKDMIKLIKKDPIWVASVIKKAKENNISISDQYYLDAFWQLDQLKYKLKKSNPNLVKEMINEIRATPDWLAKVEKKAKINKISVEEQLKLDAIWSLNQPKIDKVNNRWKRNPRTGNYSFLLVVVDENGLKKIPVSISNVGRKEDSINDFMNPYYYFLYASSMKDQKDLYVEKTSKVIKTKALIDLSKGIYVDMFKNKELGIDTLNYNEYCGSSDKLFYGAQFEQFFHNINKNFKLKNIPVVEDVVSNNYNKELYKSNIEKYKTKNIKETFVNVSTSLAKTVGYDKNLKAIFIKNPGNINTTNLVKENVGVNTRIGFTYGKYRAKIKFPKILNDDNVWNGVTCAFWLLFQDASEWNNRCKCEGGGYIPKNIGGETNERVPTNSYSEIDIEIIKTSKFWPKTSYINPKEYQIEDPSLNNNLIVACTNWDLACTEPKNFNIGAKTILYNNQPFVLHRWNDWYKALTIKYSDVESNIAGDFIYYEIDWQPDKIIWRIGKSKDNMKVIGYMDHTNTKIPDNQMVAVITQEFHDASWWPLTPWDQNFIPYPKNDIVGYIYEIEIE